MKKQSDLGYIKMPKTRDEWANLCEYIKSLNEIFNKERKENVGSKSVKESLMDLKNSGK